MTVSDQRAPPGRIAARLRSDRVLYVMLAPALVIVVVFRILPMGGIVMAFQDYLAARGFARSPWVGFEHFEAFFQSPTAARVIRNTVVLSAYQILLGFPAPIILASLFNELRCEGFKRLAQSVSYLPHFISVVVISGMIVNLLSPTNGPVNRLLLQLGLIDQPVYFLGKARWFRPIVVASDVWQDVGWGTILYMAALSKVNLELYDAALIDGANRWQQYWTVTFRALIPVTVIMLILRIARIMDSSFQKIILLYSPLTYETGDVIDSYVFRYGLEEAQYSYAAAVGIFKSAIALVLVLGANRIARRVSETSLW